MSKDDSRPIRVTGYLKGQQIRTDREISADGSLLDNVSTELWLRLVVLEADTLEVDLATLHRMRVRVTIEEES